MMNSYMPCAILSLGIGADQAVSDSEDCDLWLLKKWLQCRWYAIGTTAAITIVSCIIATLNVVHQLLGSSVSFLHDRVWVVPGKAWPRQSDVGPSQASLRLWHYQGSCELVYSLIVQPIPLSLQNIKIRCMVSNVNIYYIAGSVLCIVLLLYIT